MPSVERGTRSESSATSTMVGILRCAPRRGTTGWGREGEHCWLHSPARCAGLGAGSPTGGPPLSVPRTTESLGCSRAQSDTADVPRFLTGRRRHIAPRTPTLACARSGAPVPRAPARSVTVHTVDCRGNCGCTGRPPACPPPLEAGKRAAAVHEQCGSTTGTSPHWFEGTAAFLAVHLTCWRPLHSFEHTVSFT